MKVVVLATLPCPSELTLVPLKPLRLQPARLATHRSAGATAGSGTSVGNRSGIGSTSRGGTVSGSGSTWMIRSCLPISTTDLPSSLLWGAAVYEQVFDLVNPFDPPQESPLTVRHRNGF